jgi:hypothetical protein
LIRASLNTVVVLAGIVKVFLEIVYVLLKIGDAAGIFLNSHCMKFIK